MSNFTSYLVDPEYNETVKLLAPVLTPLGAYLSWKVKEYITKKENGNIQEEHIENSREYNYTQYDREEDVDVVLDTVWEPPGIENSYRYTRIDDDNNVVINLPPGKLEEIEEDQGSSVYIKEKSSPKEKKITSYLFETKENGNNYADCDGLYTLSEGLINKKPIYINKEKDRFLGALGPSGWCITAMQYLEGIQEMKTGSFGGFHSGGGVLPDYNTWPNYTVKPTEEEEENDTELIPKQTVQGTVSIYRKFNDKPEDGYYYFEVELKSVTQGMVQLFIKRFDKDYKFSENFSHEYKKAKNGMNVFKIDSKIGENGIKHEQVGVMVKSVSVDNKTKKKMKSKNIGYSKCIITRAYLKDKPRNTHGP